MLMLLVVVLCHAVSAGLAGPVPQGPFDREVQHIHYDQQQHAPDGNNVRVNLNKILIAILPLEEAIAGLGQFGGSETYGEEFTDLTIADLKPPKPPAEEEKPSIEEVDDNSESAVSSEAPSADITADKAPATTAASTTPEEKKPIGGAVSNRPLRNKPTAECKSDDIAAGRCRTQRRSVHAS